MDYTTGQSVNMKMWQGEQKKTLGLHEGKGKTKIESSYNYNTAAWQRSRSLGHG
jgi:hypothetical protein